MDAFVQLALIEKSKRVFAADAGVMLSFPLLAPVSFTPAELAALSAPATVADYATAADFSRMVNFLPTDMVASTTERRLWDVYGDVLARADVAEAGEADAAAARAAAEAARDLLYDDGPDGTQVESEVLKRYRQYRDAWIVAREDYAAHQLSGEMSDDPAERQRWTEVDEPVLRSALDAASSAWDAVGRRADVEAAQQALRTAALQDPRKRWSEWSQAFNPDIDLLTDAGGGTYAPTGLSPRNFVDQDWLSFDLSASEMRTLVDEAPEALKRVLDDDSGASVERVTFDYRSVALVRPWFQPDALTSGIWRSDEPDLQLSDGGDPPKGVCPAYATACVFVRNVVVTSTAATGASAGNGSTDSGGILRFTLDPARLTLRRNLLVDPGIAARLKRRTLPVEPTPPVVVEPPVAFRTLERASFLKLASAQMVAPLAVRRADLPIGQVTSVLQRRPRWVDPVDPPDPQPDPQPQPQPDPPPPTTTTSTPSDEISVLAFICKRLPAAPDPKPGMGWGKGAPPFPLPAGHMFGSRASRTIHDGKANAADRQSVRAIQAQLVKAGEKVTVDGWLGGESDKAIRRFQKAHHLSVDGSVGPVTWAALWA